MSNNWIFEDKIVDQLPEWVTGFVYQITNTVTGSVYIGSSTAIEERWRGHKSKLERGVHYSKKFQLDYDTYGKDSFVFELIHVRMTNWHILVLLIYTCLFLLII